MDVGDKLSINVGLNSLHCFGLGFEYYLMVGQWDEIDARVLRLDLLFVFINFTFWTKQL